MSINSNNSPNDALGIVFVSNTRNQTPIQNNGINKPNVENAPAPLANAIDLCWKIVDGNPLRENEENGIKKRFLCIQLNQKINVNGTSKPLYAFLPIEEIANLTSYDSKKLISKFSQLQSIQNKGKLDPNNEIVLAISYLCKKYDLDKSIQPVAKMALEQGISQVSLGQGLSGTRVQELRNKGKAIKIEEWLETNKKSLEEDYLKFTHKEADKKRAPAADSAQKEKIDTITSQLKAIYNALDEASFKVEINNASFLELNKRKWAIHYIGNADLLENRKRLIQNEIIRLDALNKKRHERLVALEDDATLDQSGSLNGPYAKYKELLKVVSETEGEIKTLTDEFEKLEAESKKESLYSKVSACFERFKMRKNTTKNENENSLNEDENEDEFKSERDSLISRRGSLSSTHSKSARFSMSESERKETSKLIGGNGIEEFENEQNVKSKEKNEDEEEVLDLNSFLGNSVNERPASSSVSASAADQNSSNASNLLTAGHDLYANPPLDSFTQQPQAQAQTLTSPRRSSAIAPLEQPQLVLTPIKSNNAEMQVPVQEIDLKHSVSSGIGPLSDFEKALVKRLYRYNTDSLVNREGELVNELKSIPLLGVAFWDKNESRLTKNSQNNQIRYINLIYDIISACKDAVDETYQKFLDKVLIKKDGNIDINASVEKYLQEREIWNDYIDEIINLSIHQINNSKLDFSGEFIKVVARVFWKIKITPHIFLDWHNTNVNNYVQDPKGTIPAIIRTDWIFYPPLFKYRDQEESPPVLRNLGYMENGN